jgi:predicted MFS family arabinose efflux permease
MASAALCLWPALMFMLLALRHRHLPRVASTAPRRKQPWTELLRHRPLRVMLVAGVMCPAGYEVFLFVLPVNGARIGLSASTIGSILGASAVAIIAMRMFMPLLVRRVRDWTIILAVFVTIAVSFLLLAVVTQTWMILLIAIVMGLAHGVGQPLVMSMFYSASPEGRQGEAAGVRGILQNACSALSPVVIGGLGTFLGLGPVLAAAAVVYAWGAWFARRQSRD